MKIYDLISYDNQPFQHFQWLPCLLRLCPWQSRHGLVHLANCLLGCADSQFSWSRLPTPTPVICNTSVFLCNILSSSTFSSRPLLTWQREFPQFGIVADSNDGSTPPHIRRPSLLNAMWSPFWYRLSLMPKRKGQGGAHQRSSVFCFTDLPHHCLSTQPQLSTPILTRPIMQAVLLPHPPPRPSSSTRTSCAILI